MCRNAAFDLELRKTTGVAVPVISIGNLTAGGTGKTPLVEMLVQRLLQMGKRTAVVSRGYGRRSRGVVVVSDGRNILVDARRGGDEAVMVARRFPTACVVVGERRVAAAQFAVHPLGAEVVVLDDGFQHRALRRDLDIVVLDARRDITREALLPAGRRREPLSALRRAGLLAFARVKDLTPASCEEELRKYSTAPAMRCRYEIRSIHRQGTGQSVPLDEIRKMRVLAFSGIGWHGGFLDDLRSLGLTVVDDIRFPDHHWYTQNDLHMIQTRMQERKAELLLTTEKDIIRLEGDRAVAARLLDRHPVHYTRLAVEVIEGEAHLQQAIDRCLKAGVKP